MLFVQIDWNLLVKYLSGLNDIFMYEIAIETNVS